MLNNLTPSQVEELCPLHPTEFMIAFDRDRSQLMCNRCIYESSQLDDVNLTFTSLIASDINVMLATQFQSYKDTKTQYSDRVNQPSQVLQHA